MSQIVYVANTNLLSLENFQNVDTGGYIDNATVSVVVKDADGVEVVPSTDMTYKTGSNGVYQCYLADTVNLKNGAHYTAIITADGGTNAKAKWEFDLLGETRTN